MSTKIAVCQVPDIREDIRSSLKWIEKFTKQAETDGISLICFPECFLQGYLTETSLAEKHAIAFDSPAFNDLLKQLSNYKTVIVVGLIEKENEDIFNTAAVIKEGVLIGKYRKTHLLGGEQVFKAGTEYPVFELNGLKFGINICYDTQFAESTASLARQGAKLVLCPSNNMMKYKTAEKFKNLHHQMRIERAKENRVWLMSADVTGEREGRIAYGPTSVINPDGDVVVQVALMETGMVGVEV